VTNKTAILCLLGINAVLALGDALAKIASPGGRTLVTTTAIILWICACLAWIPVMRAPGFTRLIAFSDAIGLLMVAAVGKIFLGEHLSNRELIGLALALSAIGFLSSP
jgi:multidrug transporter EmrE-like cation transporter